MLYAAFALMGIILALFVVAWLRSPKLRAAIEEPKYRLLGESTKDSSNT
jgi:hypothetical protein